MSKNGQRPPNHAKPILFGGSDAVFHTDDNMYFVAARSIAPVGLPVFVGMGDKMWETDLPSTGRLKSRAVASA